METLGENEVNPGCIFKKFVLKIPMENPTNKIKNKKPKFCKIKKKPAHVIKLHQRRLKEHLFSFDHRRLKVKITLHNQI